MHLLNNKDENKTVTACFVQDLVQFSALSALLGEANYKSVSRIKVIIALISQDRMDKYLSGNFLVFSDAFISIMHIFTVYQASAIQKNTKLGIGSVSMN